MRVFHINAVPYGSTGRIMFALADLLEAQGHQALCTTGFTWKKSNRPDHFITSNIITKKAHSMMAYATGRIGCFSVAATAGLLRRMDAFQPDVIHLHNLHGWFVNLPMLFGYIKKHNIPVVWTFHDCWPMTGHCPHFALSGCDRWKTGCHHCAQHREYPASGVDASEAMWRLKKKWFTGVRDLTIVAPSRWLGDLVTASFLKDYPVKIINNGIDTELFRPRESDFRAKYHLEDKFILLGVAFDWGYRKGLDVFTQLSRRLDGRFQIVLVGTDDSVDRELPDSIVSIHRTDSPEALAELYSAADLFVNPTREDTYPTVNMESLACGTPVLTFRTGGSPEIPDDTCGCVVDCDDVDALHRQILRIADTRPYTSQSCLNRAAAFSAGDRYQEYLDLYRQMAAGNRRSQ